MRISNITFFGIINGVELVPMHRGLFHSIKNEMLLIILSDLTGYLIY